MILNQTNISNTGWSPAPTLSKALDAKTGAVAWEVNTVLDANRSYTITGAPRIIKDKVIIGNGGAELGVIPGIDLTLSVNERRIGVHRDDFLWQRTVLAYCR